MTDRRSFYAETTQEMETAGVLPATEAPSTITAAGAIAAIQKLETMLTACRYIHREMPNYEELMALVKSAKG